MTNEQQATNIKDMSTEDLHSYLQDLNNHREQYRLAAKAVTDELDQRAAKVRAAQLADRLSSHEREALMAQLSAEPSNEPEASEEPTE